MASWLLRTWPSRAASSLLGSTRKKSQCSGASCSPHSKPYCRTDIPFPEGKQIYTHCRWHFKEKKHKTSEPVVLRYGGAMISKWIIIIIIKMTLPTPTFAAVFVHFLLQQSLSRLLHLNCFLVLVLFNLLNLWWISAACVSRKGGLTSHSRVSGFRLKAPRQ